MGKYIYLINTINNIILTINIIMCSILIWNRIHKKRMSTAGSIVFLVVAAICTITLIFMPNKKDLYAMSITEVMTEQNLKRPTKEVKELVDYTIDKINKGE